MFHEKLRDALKIGEDQSLEFKGVYFQNDVLSGPKQNVLADEIAAFANTDGGYLLLGVEDKTQDVLGIPAQHMDSVEKLLIQASEDSLYPACPVKVHRLSLADQSGTQKLVILVNIPKSLDLHKSPSGFLYRRGSSKRAMPQSLMERGVYDRRSLAHHSYDAKIVHEATLEDLDEKLWRRFFTKRSKGDQHIILSKLRIIARDEDGVWRPTVAGLLMASQHPEEFLPVAYIQAVAYRGTKISSDDRQAYQLDAQDMTGPLDKQIFDACYFVRRNMKVRGFKGGDMGGRTDVPQFDMIAVFEAITNAVAHRDYAMGGSKIRIRQFTDRLELYVPGRLYNGMVVGDIPYAQAIRNQSVVSLLSRCPMEYKDLKSHRDFVMERRGEGVPAILDRSEKLSGKTPVYEFKYSEELTLTIYSAGEEPPEGFLGVT